MILYCNVFLSKLFVDSYANVMKQMRKENAASVDDSDHSCDGDDFSSESCDIQCNSNRSRSSTNNNNVKWPTSTSKSSGKSLLDC